MIDANAIEVQIRAQIDQLLKGLKDAAAATGDAGQRMQTELAGLSKGAEGAGSAMDEFVHHVRGMRQEAFLGNFMARQIADVGIASKGAAAELTGFVSAFAVGGGIGLAIESVKLIAKAFNEAGEETRKANELAEESLKKLKAQADSLIMSITGLSEAEKLRRTNIEPLEAQELEQKKALSRAYADLFRAEEQLDEAKKNKTVGAEEVAAYNVAKGMVEEKQKLLDITKKQIEESKKLVGGVEGAQGEKEHEETLRAIEEGEKQHNQRMMELSAQLLHGQERMQAEFYAKAASLRARALTTDLQDEEEIDLQKKKLFQDVVADRDQQQQKMLKDHQKWLDAVIKAEFDASEKVRGYIQHLADVHNTEMERMSKAQQKAADDLVRDFSAANSIVGQMLSVGLRAALGEERDFAQAFKSIMISAIEAVIQKLLEMAEIEIATKIVSTIANAGGLGNIFGSFFTDAAGGLTGVTTVGGVGADLGANVGLALPGAVPAFASGADIPFNLNPIAQLHGGEMVLPARTSDAIRAMADRHASSSDSSIASSGGRGGDTHVHIHASIVDGQWWRQHEGNVVRTIKEATRKGRL